MSQDERARYIRAVQTISTDPLYKLEYESLLQKHFDLFNTSELRLYGKAIGIKFLIHIVLVNNWKKLSPFQQRYIYINGFDVAL